MLGSWGGNRGPGLVVVVVVVVVVVKIAVLLLSSVYRIYELYS